MVMPLNTKLDLRLQLFLYLLLLWINNTKCISDEVLHLSVVACGDRLEETLVMIKSTCLFSRQSMHFHIFADDDLQPLFKKQLNTWPDFIRKKFEFSVYPITYPEGENEVNWKKLFKPCATQRLFIPYVLEKYTKGIRRMIYVDTDILFMCPLENVWAHFNKFNETHIAGLTPEHEAPWMGWYNRFARHPYYGEMGVNSGVMLMDLHRLRDSNWLNLMIENYKIYRYNITWGDQDLINIFFSIYPEKLYIFDCHWNYRPDHCMYGSVCKQAEEFGVQVLHGNRGYYHNDKMPSFKAIYQAVRDYKFGQDLKENLLDPIKTALQDTGHTYCGKSSHLLIKELENQIKNIKDADVEVLNDKVQTGADKVLTLNDDKKKQLADLEQIATVDNKLEDDNKKKTEL